VIRFGLVVQGASSAAGWKANKSGFEPLSGLSRQSVYNWETAVIHADSRP